MKTHRLRNSIYIIILLVIVLGLAILFGAFRSSSIAPQAKEPLAADDMKVLVSKGRELGLAGDCMGCHSQPQGAEGAGGVAGGAPLRACSSSRISPATAP